MERDDTQRPSHDLSAWLESFRGADITDAEVAAAAERLLADREAALPLLVEQFADPTEDATLLAVATVTLQSWPAPHPVKLLMAMLKRPEVGALGKALIMNVLERYGIDMDGTGLLGVGVDLEAYELDPMTNRPGVSPN